MLHCNAMFRIGSTAVLLALGVPLRAQTAGAAQGAPNPANSRAETGVNVSARAPDRVTGTGPGGATLRCRDGSYLVGPTDDGACAAKGGLLVRFPLRRVPERTVRPAAAAVPEPPTRAQDAVPPDAVMENRARVVIPAEPPPANATFQCRDGTYVVADTSRARCGARGGVRLAFPAKPRG
ncbi:MAG: hypothetical protein IPJ78_13860 [Gemmatimonadetes bacterium]|nr:hypothetical protein [Gemmatimonadota bacterium]